MKNIELYTPDGLKTLEFHFNNPIVEFNSDLGWATIKATGRTITIYGNPFIVYDDEVHKFSMPADFPGLWKNDMNEAYQNGQKALVIFLKNGTPILTFYGEKISLAQKVNDFCYFLIDEKPIWLDNMNFLILAKN